jgi:hypothetical protein
MGVLPVPEEVKNMHGKIERTLESLFAQNRLFESIAERLDQLKTNEEQIADIGEELGEIRNCLTVIKDSIRFDRVA